MTSQNLASPLDELIRHQPQRTALWVGGREFTYEQLGEHIRAVAGWISQAIDHPAPRIGILAGRNLTAYVGILATTYAGGAYVPLNVKAPVDYLNQILHFADVDALIVDQVGTDILGSCNLKNLPSVILSPFDNPSDTSFPGLAAPIALESQLPLESPGAVDKDSTAYIMFTSGTTGSPKGIAVTVGNILHLLTTLQNRYHFTPNDRVSQAFELTFDLSVFDIFMALRAGSSLHVVPEHQMATPAQFIRQQELTTWFSVPSMIGLLKRMNMLQPEAFSSLRLSLFCGEALPTESVRSWREAAPHSKIENLYGPTEATVACLLQDCTDRDAETPGRGIIAIGRPFDGLHAGIVNPEGQFLPRGQSGELAIHGPQVAPGYLNNTQLTAERFPMLQSPDLGLSRWYLTGDLAYQDQEGRYHFLGRRDNQVQLRGYRVELDEIEHHLRLAARCDTAVAIFFDHADIWSREIVGVIPHGSANPAIVRKRLLKRLPPYMVPKKVVSLSSWPRNASGKIDRKAVRERVEQGSTPSKQG